MDQNFNYLSYFLGPKGENSDFFAKTLNTIFLDYIHWRRNYYPGDKIISTTLINREFAQLHDALETNTFELIAGLRRNFPFYSPRYIAHMLSDITLPSALGYFAGMLYNANNVTPEAAPVTVEWEIEGCNEILKMIGYKPSPVPPGKEAKIEEWKKYQQELKSEFGWSHLTSGGTVANIEALWVAKLVKYFPLSVQDAAKQNHIDIEIKIGEEIKKITELTEYQVVNIRPNESIYLLARYIEAVARRFNLNIAEANTKGLQLLSKSKYNLTGSTGKLYTDFPCVIFASGAAHYCIKKAADLLGIGRDNVVLIKTDSAFRMDIQDLERKIRDCKNAGKIPLAVIGVAGTTEEGAVDPIHKILDLRIKLEKEEQLSFWVHVDAAWGGYIASIFNMDDSEELNEIIQKLIKKLSLSTKHVEEEQLLNILGSFIHQKIQEMEEAQKMEVARSSVETDKPISDNQTSRPKGSPERKSEHLNTIWERAKNLYKTNENESFLSELKEIFNILDIYKKQDSSKTLNDKDFRLGILDRTEATNDFICETINMEYKSYKKEKEVRWGSKDVIYAFHAFSKADSVTIDPHKMGYMQYPIGVICFRNDRVRHFIMQRAPYITSTGHNALLHTPPRHVEGVNFEKLKEDNLPYENYSVAIDAFAPFMLEGSKPGAAAASLWLATKSIPLNRKHHGQIIRSSLLSTRELYEWVQSWEKITKYVKEDSIYYSFHPVSLDYPDLNLFIFTVKSHSENSLQKLNELTKMVYDDFTIQAELGDREHSYSQPFFLSKTTFTSPEYTFESLKPFFASTLSEADINNIKNEYLTQGLIVLRATLMNPYLHPLKKLTKQNFIKEFMIELHKAANRCAREMAKGG